MKWSIYGVDGELLDVSDCSASVRMGKAPSGLLGLMPVTFDGASRTERGVAAKGPRPVGIDLLFDLDTEDALYERIEYVARALDPEWGDMRIVAEKDDGSQRDIVATYDSGFEPTVEWQGKRTARASFRALCFQPYWSSVTELSTELTFPVSGSGATLTGWDHLDMPWDAAGVPWDGFSASDADATARTDLSVAGTAPAWPRFEITGPGTSVVLHNADAAESFRWDGVLSAGESMSVEFDRRMRHVRIDGTSVWSGLSDSSGWWRLKPGNVGEPQVNSLLVQVLGSDASTTCSMYYRPMYLSP